MLCLNSLCLFISAYYLKICVDKTSWLVVSLNLCPSVWGPQTLKEQSERFLTFETMIIFLTLVLLRYNKRCDSRDLWPLWHLFRVMRWPDLTKKPLRCCDIWDTDYNTDNWEPEFMTIFVIWQLIVTLDSIRNSCDVFVSRTRRESYEACGESAA